MPGCNARVGTHHEETTWHVVLHFLVCPDRQGWYMILMFFHSLRCIYTWSALFLFWAIRSCFSELKSPRGVGRCSCANDMAPGKAFE